MAQKAHMLHELSYEDAFKAVRVMANRLNAIERDPGIVMYDMAAIGRARRLLARCRKALGTHPDAPRQSPLF